MKKICLLTLSYLLIAAMAITVFAAGKVTFTMTVSEEELSAGDEITLTASCSADAEATSYGLMLKYDEDIFEYINGNVTVENTLVKSMGAGTSHGFVFMFEEAAAYSGQVGTVVLKVKASAPAGTYVITGAASVKNGAEIVETDNCAVTVTVSKNTVAQESSAASKPDVDAESIPDPSMSKPIVKDEDAVPATGDTPKPGTDSTLTIGALPEENKKQDDPGFPAWIFLVAAGVIAMAGILGFVIVKKKK